MSDEEIIIHSKQDCKYCVMAKDFLNQRGISFTTVNHTDKVERLDFLEDLSINKNRGDPATNSFPQIFINGKRIGGYQELLTHFSFKEDADF